MADDPLDEIAGSVSDGKPVDWDGVEAQGALQEGASVRAMRDLERIAEFNRVLQRGGAEQGVVESTESLEPEGEKRG